MSMDLATPSVSAGARESATPDTTARRVTGAVDDWSVQLRLHQWTKNLLIFVPLFLGHIAGDGAAWRRTIIGFLAFGLVASATYILNDLNDRDFDRLHRTKRFRPLAAGRIDPIRARAVAFVMSAFGGVVAWRLSPHFAEVVALYVGLTLAYTLRLKREPLMDVAVIGALFTFRVLMGAVLNNLTPSPWMLSFAAFFFFSLALAKRHSEVMRAGQTGMSKLPGRGYQAADWPLTLAFGVAAGLAAIVVMLLFVVLEAQVSGAYGSARFLFAAPICVSLWLMRIWLFSHRMTLDDDPLLFACKDWVSYVLGAVTLLGFVLAL